MFFPGKIFGRVDILRVSFRSSSEYSCSLLKCKYSAKQLTLTEEESQCDPETVFSKDSGAPCIIVYCGYGIISKKRSELPEKLLEKITSGSEEFLWNEDSSGVISLLRHEQTAELEEVVAKTKVRPIGRLLTWDEENEKLLADCSRHLDETIRFKRLFRADATGSQLCKIVFAKSKLAVLGIILALLVANHFRGERAEAELLAVQAQLIATERALGAAGEKDRQKNALIEKYDRRIPHGFSWICDRIAIVLPKTMTLKSMAIQPLAKKAENGKQMQFSDRKIEITGNASNTEDIMLYISALTRLQFAKEVKMVSMEQERNSTDLLFHLMLTL